MTPRERNLAIFMGGFFVVAGLGAAYFFVYEPLQAKSATASGLEEEVQKLEARERELRAIEPKLRQAQFRSLPADSNTARREYATMMTRMLARAGVPQNAVTVKEKTISDVRGIPLLANKKPAYVRVAFDIDLKNVDMWQVEEFLRSRPSRSSTMRAAAPARRTIART
jgi:hypothetical protein